jgi:hypothetical protein
MIICDVYSNQQQLCQQYFRMELASVADLRAVKDSAIVIDVRGSQEVQESGVKVDGMDHGL